MGSARHLHQPLSFQGLDGGAQIQVGAEEEEVQRIRYRRCSRGSPAWHRNSRHRELSCTDCAEGVGRARAEQIQAKLFGRGPVDAGKAHLQKDLRVSGGNLDIQQVDDLAGGGRNLHRAFGAGEVLNRATKKDLAVLEACLDLLIGQLCLELAA